MKATTAQINLVPAPLRVSLAARRPVVFQVPQASLFLMLAMIVTIAGGILLPTALPSGSDWNEFVTCAKTISITRCEAAPVQTCVPSVPPGPWTFNAF
jgi:hypothetical protein